MNEIINTIKNEKVIAIVRMQNKLRITNVIDILIQSGVKVLEITKNSIDFEQLLPEVLKKYPNILIGAGTIKNKKDAKLAIKLGAKFLVTPNVEPSIVKVAHEFNIPVVMGALSPTEIVTAIDSGADIIKLFPCNFLGVEYFNALKGPFSDVSFLAVGGISPSNYKIWLNSGVSGIGIGSEFLNKNDLELKMSIEALINEIKCLKNN